MEVKSRVVVQNSPSKTKKSARTISKELLKDTHIAPPYALKKPFARRYQPIARFRIKVRSSPMRTCARQMWSPPAESSVCCV